jgi:hypothetical protein
VIDLVGHWEKDSHGATHLANYSAQDWSWPNHSVICCEKGLKWEIRSARQWERDSCWVIDLVSHWENDSH